MSQDQRLELQFNALQSYQDTVQAGRISALLVHFTGTNDTGTPAGPDDLGDFTIKYKGKTIVNRPVNVFTDMLNIRRGSNLLDSTANGAFSATCIIPFYEKSFEQAMQIMDGNELKVEYSPGPSAPFGNLQATVYSQLSFLDMEYMPMILGNDITPGGNLNSSPEQLHQNNITSVFIQDPSNQITEVGLKQDGVNVYSEQPFDVIKAKTLADNRLEQDDTDMVQLKSYTKGKPNSIISDKNVLQLSTDGGSGNLIPVTYVAMVPLDEG